MAAMLSLDRVAGHSFIPGLLPENSIILDLGANYGDFSQGVVRRYGWQCHAVEPTPGPFAAIPSHTNIRKHGLAIAPADGPVTFHLSSNSQASSMFAGNASSGDNHAASQLTVQGLSLSSFMNHAGIPRVDLVKVDIEGGEYAMFQSLSDEQIASVRQFTIEFHLIPGQSDRGDVFAVMGRLCGLGFYMIRMSGTSYGDVLFVNRRLAGASWFQLAVVKHVNRNLIFTRRLLKTCGLWPRR